MLVRLFSTRLLANSVTQHFQAGELNLAQTAAEHFLKVASLEHGANSLQSATAHNSLGTVLLHAKQFDTSEACLTVAARLFEHFYGAKHVVTLTSRASLSEALYFKGEIDKALAVLTTVVEDFQETDKLLCAKYSLGLAEKLGKQGNTSSAKAWLDEASRCLSNRPNVELERQLELVKRHLE
jgi:tetratricopeptide (TPR) repeat protein